VLQDLCVNSLPDYGEASPMVKPESHQQSEQVAISDDAAEMLHGTCEVRAKSGGSNLQTKRWIVGCWLV
jgi:hypothetical protein